MRSYVRLSAACPFFRNDDNERTVLCEGPIDSTTVAMKFGTKKQFMEHLQGWCCNAKGYRNCEMYRLVSEKYLPDCEDE